MDLVRLNLTSHASHHNVFSSLFTPHEFLPEIRPPSFLDEPFWNTTMPIGLSDISHHPNQGVRGSAPSDT